MDLYRIFKPVIFISRVFCLAPFVAVEESGCTRYKFSTFWLLYSILGVCATFIFLINVLWTPLFFSGAIIFNVTAVIMTVASFVASVVAQVLCLNNGKNVLTILDNVSVLDSENIGARINYCRLYRVFIILLSSSIISLVVPVIMTIATINPKSVYILKILYYIAVYFICDVVLVLSDTQFIHFVLLLKYRFSVLNDTVINFTVQSIHKTSLNHTIIAPAVDRSVNSSTSAVSSSTTMLKSTLRKVCLHHDSLCDISEFVNRTYSLQILLIVTVNFIKVLISAQGASIEIASASMLQYISSTKSLSMSTFAWIFTVTAKVVLLVVVCNRTSHEVSGLQLRCPHICFRNTWPTE